MFQLGSVSCLDFTVTTCKLKKAYKIYLLSPDDIFFYIFPPIFSYIFEVLNVV